jgi:hypothetical protein
MHLGVYELRAFDINALRTTLKMKKFALWNLEAI